MKTQASNRVGQTFGKLTVEAVVGRHVFPSGASAVVVSCVCECGKRRSVLLRSLVSGNTKSCGCLLAKNTGDRTRRHGMYRTKEYSAWAAMLARCTNPNHPNYKHYGGRGITVDESWSVFDNFIRDMGRRPKGASIERVDNNMGYSKTNCVWADRFTQARNKRPRADNTSGVRGVGYDKTTGMWKVQLYFEGKNVWGGRFKEISAAIEKRRALEAACWGLECQNDRSNTAS